eukprot:gene8765-biopygen9195
MGCCNVRNPLKKVFTQTGIKMRQPDSLLGREQLIVNEPRVTAGAARTALDELAAPLTEVINQVHRRDR